MYRKTLAILAPLVALSVACDPSPAADDEPRRLYTLFEIQDALRTSAVLPAGPLFGNGIAPDTILTRGTDNDSLKITAAFSEGDPAAYVTTALWMNFPEVWVQPWYVLISAWNDKPPRDNKLDDGTNPVLFDPGPKSPFYSPFWQILYAVVDKASPPGKYTSSRQLFDEGAPIYQGAPWFYDVRPTNVVLMPAKPLHPILGVEVGNLSASNNPAIVDGESFAYFNVGGNNFRYDDKLVVEEVPLFIFARRDVDGRPVRVGAPDVVGSSPLFSRRPADVLNGSPRFGAFTRLYMAYLPAAAAAFDPAANPATVARLAALPTPIDAKIYQGRIAMARECFAMETFPGSCRWLDSQQKIEDALGRAGIERTPVTAATPMVFYGGRAIGAR